MGWQQQSACTCSNATVMWPALWKAASLAGLAGSPFGGCLPCGPVYCVHACVRVCRNVAVNSSWWIEVQSYQLDQQQHRAQVRQRQQLQMQQPAGVVRATEVQQQAVSRFWQLLFNGKQRLILDCPMSARSAPFVV
jgi:hypothetical protein